MNHPIFRSKTTIFEPPLGTAIEIDPTWIRSPVLFKEAGPSSVPVAHFWDSTDARCGQAVAPGDWKDVEVRELETLPKIMNN